jgi:hypothetical protein
MNDMSILPERIFSKKKKNKIKKKGQKIGKNIRIVYYHICEVSMIVLN